ncbi:pyrophosphorylase [Shewanella hanedai]|uniref:Bifunctional cytidylyltransferase/SDR family oxidoreductase n=1 Tax=Shewanella hanedai TaxID=25 RepID=A0A553JMJ6_SHEHA|nr:bifunctional cytidylyltransferase/SDR family oxidoreductase [Shewanella hanedai]TRY13682.1 bifunctional cytidylyltransferase/SDR family oxidoreductase [Shewanella hanedai]GGI98607.1 pyrophosphorylase [Shewanella hanedai]
MKNIAVILAGGKGSRFGSELPKQFSKVAGKMVIEHTIAVFENNKSIDEICIISNSESIHLIDDLVLKNQFSKVKKVLLGGKERSDSSMAAINSYDFECNLIFHDAVRPLVTDIIINNTVSALCKNNVVDVAVKATDTIVNCSNGLINNIPNRDDLWNGQTPQAFKRSVIKKAYEYALSDPEFLATDDCGVVKKYLPVEDIYVVEGDVTNIKLTHKQDLFLIDKLFQLKTTEIVERYNVTKLNEAMKNDVVLIVGGSYGIGKSFHDELMRITHNVYSLSRSENGIDITNYTDVNNFIEKIYKTHGRIDKIIITAAKLDKQPLFNMSMEDVISSVDINYLSVINILKSSYEYLKESRGKVLLFTSSSYTRGRSSYSIYSSTKSAIVNLTQALSEEWYHDGITINCINPERTNTPMRTKNFGNEDQKTLLKSEDVAKVSLMSFLTNINGSVIDVKVNNE